MKDILKYILIADLDMKELTFGEKSFINKERALVNDTLTTYKLTKEMLEESYRRLLKIKEAVEKSGDSVENYDISAFKNMNNDISVISLKYEIAKFLLENLTEGLTYRGLLNYISSNKNYKEWYNETVLKIVSIVENYKK